MKRILFLTSLALVLLSSSLKAQEIEVQQDFGLWTGLDLELKHGNFVSFVSPKLRLNQNAVKLDKLIWEMGTEYRIDKRFSLGSAVRYTKNHRRLKATQNNFRFQFDLKFKAPISERLALNTRLRYQSTYIDLLKQYEQTREQEEGFRYKAGLLYSLNSKHQAYLSCELFRITEPFERTAFSKFRLVLGDKFKLGKGKINLGLAYQQELNEDLNEKLVMIRLNYRFRL